MRSLARSALFAALVLGLAYSLPINAFEGRWVWDPARSTRAATDMSASPARKTLLTLAANNRHFTEVSEIVDEAGVRHHSEFDAVVNNGLATVTGSQEGEHVLVRHEDPFSYTFEIAYPDGSRATEICMVEHNGMTQVCRGELTNAAGQSAAYVDTYERE